MTLRPHQIKAVEAVEAGWGEFRRQLLVAPTGCHAPGQRILMFDGTAKKVEDIVPGDLLNGGNGVPRRVLHLCRGLGEMVRVTPVKGASFVVNEDHLLTLVRTNDGSRHAGSMIDVSVKEWERWNATDKHVHKLIRVATDFATSGAPLPLDPYFLGVLLGDGCLCNGTISVCKPDPEIRQECEDQARRLGMTLTVSGDGTTNPSYVFGSHNRHNSPLKSALQSLGLRGVNSATKFIPREYKTADRASRIAVLSGLIDTDGSLSGNGYDFISKSEKLANDVAFVARSLGLAAYVSECRKGCQTGAVGTCFRVSINGDTSILATRIPRKQAAARRQTKSVLRTGFSVERIGSGRFCGFHLDGDGRYLLDDFTLTHNSGKTIVFSALADRQPGRTLILAHREELIDQAVDKIGAAVGIAASVEKAERVADRDARVVVASVQTLRGARLESWSRDHFDLIVVDECHHTLADSYQGILSHFGGARVLGVTATPNVKGKRELGRYFETIACEISLLDLIEQGWLSKIRVQSIPVQIDLRDVRVSGGDYDAESLGETLSPVLRSLADQLPALIGDRKTLIFLPLIATSQAFCALLRERGLAAEHISGVSEDRAEILSRFSAGEFQVLTNAMLLTEGYDEPSISCVLVLRPTRSPVLFGQAVGRGTRIHPGKEDLLLLDPLWLHERHSLIRPAHLVAASDEEAEQMTRAIERASTSGGGSSEDLIEVQGAARAEREAKLEAELREKMRRKARVIDVRAWAAMTHSLELDEWEPTMSWHAQPVTPRQRELLERWKIDVSSIRGKGHASRLIDQLMRRREKRLATPAQVQLMTRLGHRDPARVSMAEATEWIGRRIGGRRAA